LAVRATTAAVRASILDSRDMVEAFFTSYGRLNYEAVFNERLDDFTKHIRRLPVLSHFGVKFLVTVGGHPYSQKLGFGFDGCHKYFLIGCTKCSTAVIRLCNRFKNIFGKRKAPVVRPGLLKEDTMKKLATAITSENIV
jgi:hypothetical protein